MKLFIRVKPGAKSARFKKIDDTHFEVWVKEVPQEGRANQAVLEVVSEYLGIPPSTIRIKSGLKSHRKVLEIR